MEELAKNVHEGDVAVRKWTKADIPFIVSGWMKSYRNGAAVRGIPDSIYNYYYRRVIHDLLKRAYVIVLCDSRDPDTLVGFVCAEKSDTALIVHYVYIKGRYQGFGLARRVIKELIEAEQPSAVFYTHKTFFVKDYRDRCAAEGKIFALGEWVYNPFLVYVNLQKDWANV